MNYFYQKGTRRLFVLFHGTGGNDTSLLFLSGELDAQASVLSFEGNVGTGQQRRFFAPLIQGRHVDRDDLALRVNEFLNQWDHMSEHQMADEIIFIGYSNGANFILALLEQRPDIANKSILLHPSGLGWKFSKKALKNQLIFTLGANDYIAPPGPLMQLKKELEPDMFPKVDVVLLDSAHGVTDEEIKQIKMLI